MGTKQVTSSQYAPTGMSTYNQVVPQAGNVWSAFMQNPLQNSFFQQNQQMANNQIHQGAQSNIYTMLNNMKQLGVGGTGGSSPFLASMLAQQGRATSGQLSNSFMQNLLGTNQLRMSAANAAGGFQPLQTGSTQQTSGLGTWLPQLAGGLMGALSGGMMGGAKPPTSMFGGAGAWGNAFSNPGSTSGGQALNQQMIAGMPNPFLQQ